MRNNEYLPPTLKLGVTGLSWGGAMAACAALASRLPVSCIPCIAPATIPWVGFVRYRHMYTCIYTRALTRIFDMPDGHAVRYAYERVHRGSPSSMAIDWQLDWDAVLRDETRTPEHATSDLAIEVARLTVSSLLSSGGAPTIGSVVQVSAVHDHYVPAFQGLKLYDSLRKAVRPRSMCALEWIEGGHVTAHIRMTAAFVPAIVKAIECQFRADSD